jgi:hypothetical protein
LGQQLDVVTAPIMSCVSNCTRIRASCGRQGAFASRAARVGRNWRRPARLVSQDNMATNGLRRSRVSSASDCQMLVMDGPFSHKAPEMEEFSIELVASVPESEDVPATRANSNAGLREHLVALRPRERAASRSRHQIHGRSSAPTKGDHLRPAVIDILLGSR